MSAIEANSYDVMMVEKTLEIYCALKVAGIHPYAIYYPHRFHFPLADRAGFPTTSIPGSRDEFLWQPVDPIKSERFSSEKLTRVCFSFLCSDYQRHTKIEPILHSIISQEFIEGTVTLKFLSQFHVTINGLRHWSFWPKEMEIQSRLCRVLTCMTGSMRTI